MNDEPLGTLPDVFARQRQSRWLEELGYRLEGLCRRTRVAGLRWRFGDRFSGHEAITLEAGLCWQIGLGGYVSLAPGSTIRHGTDLKVDGELVVGARSLIGPWTVLSVLCAVRIGQDVLIAERVSIRDHDHRHRGAGPVGLQGYNIAPVQIGDGCWIGAGAVVCEGVELGARCVVGANSVVLQSFGPGTVVAGAPARAIGHR